MTCPRGCLAKFFELCRKERIGCGYPIYARAWLEVTECRACGLIEGTWDDILAKPRPAHFEIDKSYMFFEATVNGRRQELFSRQHPDLYVEFVRKVNGQA